MANISKELDLIKNAIYAVEVRGAIHDAIEQAYNDATREDGGGEDVYLEVKLARGYHSNLNSRLRFLEDMNKSDLKEQKEYLVEKIHDEIKGLGTMSPKKVFKYKVDLEDEYPNGNDGIYVVTDTKKWYYWTGERWESGDTYQPFPWDDLITEEGEDW